MTFPKIAPVPFLILLAACSSGGGSKRTVSGDGPAWMHQPTRTVDNGYLVYVGQGQDTTLERATFKAESMAIADLANECSFAPKGARIEDRYTENVAGVEYAYAKIGVTFEECEAAKKAVSPDALKTLANTAMTEQLKRYQEMYYTTAENIPEGNPPPQAPAGAAGGPGGYRTGGMVVVQTWPEYYVVRQQVVYEKQAVILGAPPPPTYMASVARSSEQIRSYEAANPTVRSSPRSWTSVQNHPEFRAPGGMPRPSAQVSGARMRSYTPPHENQKPPRRRRGGHRWRGSAKKADNVG